MFKSRRHIDIPHNKGVEFSVARKDRPAHLEPLPFFRFNGKGEYQKRPEDAVVPEPWMIDNILSMLLQRGGQVMIDFTEVDYIVTAADPTAVGMFATREPEETWMFA